MIKLNFALKQDEVIKILEEKGFTFVEKKGIQLFFNGPESDDATNAKNAKEIIKATDLGKAMFFNVEAV